MAEKTGTPLTAIGEFPADVAKRLAGLWITTAEELVSAAEQENGLAGLVSVTGLSLAEVRELVEKARVFVPPHISFLPEAAEEYGLGALDEHEPGDEEEGGAPQSLAPLPPSVDLRHLVGPVRNQGGRGTCVAFASTAVRESLLGQQGDLSEQFLYWACKKADMLPGGGTFIRVAMNRLELEGIPPESVWAYNPSKIPDNEGQDPPPAGAIEKAKENRIGSFKRLTPTSVDALRRALADGKLVAFAVPVYKNWFSAPTGSSGDVRLPLPDEKSVGGHAMCMVGYKEDPDVPGGGYFIVRNSWGTGWASQSAIAAGHARLPFEYIARHGNSAFVASLAAPPAPSWWERLLDWLRHLFKFGYT